MADDQKQTDDQELVGKGEGGADASGPGNILAGVQPDERESEQPGKRQGEEHEERREG